MQTLDEDGAVDPWRRRARRPRRQMPLWQELPLLLVVAFCLAVLIRTFLLQAFFIPSGSMEDTLLVGDRVLVNKVVYDVRDPVRGEVVVFRGTDRWAPQVDEEPEPGFAGRLSRTVGDLVGVSRPGEKDFIKRVVALPGDRVKCCDAEGRVVVNGTPLDESSYVLRDSPLDIPPNPASAGPGASRRSWSRPGRSSSWATTAWSPRTPAVRVRCRSRTWWAGPSRWSGRRRAGAPCRCPRPSTTSPIRRPPPPVLHPGPLHADGRGGAVRPDRCRARRSRAFRTVASGRAT